MFLLVFFAFCVLRGLNGVGLCRSRGVRVQEFFDYVRELWYFCLVLVCEEDSIFLFWKISQFFSGEEWGGFRFLEISLGVFGFREILFLVCKVVFYVNVFIVFCVGRCVGMLELWRFIFFRFGGVGQVAGDGIEVSGFQVVAVLVRVQSRIKELFFIFLVEMDLSREGDVYKFVEEW